MSTAIDGHARLLEYVQEAFEQPTYELEAVLQLPINKEQFHRIFLGMKEDKGLLKQSESDDLDIRWNEEKHLRYTIHGIEAIKAYCAHGTLPAKPTIVKKKNIPNRKPITPTELQEMPVRWNLKEEVEQTEAPMSALVAGTFAVWRLKKRWTFVFEHLQVDLTLVKQVEGSSFVPRGALQRYEVEVEMIPPLLKKQLTKTHAEKTTKALLARVEQVLLLAEGTNHWISATQKDRVLEAYLDAVGPLLRRNKKGITLSQVRQRSRDFFLGTQPSTLLLHDLPTLMTPDAYTVTEKADGERMLAVVLQRRVYLLDIGLGVQDSGITLSGHSEKEITIADGEWIKKNQYGEVLETPKFFAFDLALHEGKDVRTLPLRERLDRLQATGLQAKVFRPLQEVSLVFREQGRLAFPYKIDGLIFTPNDPTGKAMGLPAGKLPTTFKWKPPEENTIDFLVIFEEPLRRGKDAVRVGLYVSMVRGGGREGKGIYDPMQIFEQDPTAVTGNKGNEEFIPIRFRSATFSVTPGELHPTCVNDEREVIYDKMIVECKYEDGWVPIKIRHDKTSLYQKQRSIRSAANAYRTAEGTWHSIQYPVTKALLCGDQIADPTLLMNSKDAEYYVQNNKPRHKAIGLGMRDYHNMVKRGLLSRTAETTRNTLKKGKPLILWDTSCGRGGDLQKWVDAKFEAIVGTDLNQQNLVRINDSAYYRLSAMQLDRTAKGKPEMPPMLFFEMDAGAAWSADYARSLQTTTADLAQFVWGSPLPTLVEMVPRMKVFSGLAARKEVSVVSCQFSMHYFFGDLDTLDRMLANVAGLLRRGGVFVGTCLDGWTVSRALEATSTGEMEGVLEGTRLWQITKDYTEPMSTEDPTQNIGMAIRVYMDSIHQTLTEYLVDFALLEERGEKHGLRLQATEMFDAWNLETFAKLTDVEKQYSRMNRWFLFEKTT